MLLPTPMVLSNKRHLMLLCLMGYGLYPANLYAADPSQRLSEFIRAEEQARQRLHGEAGQGGNALNGRFLLGRLEISCAALQQRIAEEEAADRNKIPPLKHPQAAEAAGEFSDDESETSHANPINADPRATRRFRAEVEGSELELRSEIQSVLGEEADPKTCEALEALRIIEESWRGTVRWASIDSFLQRLGYLFSIRRQNIGLPNIQETESCCPKPVWLSGGSLPLHSQNNRRAVNFVDGLRQGIDFAVFRGIHLGLTALVIYQLNSWLHEPTSSVCQHDAETKRNLFGLLAFYENSDDNVLLSVFHDVLSPDSKILGYLRYGLLFPLAFGLGKGGWNTRNSYMTPEETIEELQKIQDIIPSFYNDFIRWLLPLPPIDRVTGNLMKNMLWNGDLKAEELQRIFDIFDGLAKSGRWYTAIHGLGYLAPIAHGMNMYDLQKFAQKKEAAIVDMAEALLDQEDAEPIGDQAQDQSAINKRLELKAKALLTLQELARLHDKDGQRKSIAESGLAIYAQYLLWSLGASRSWYEAAGQTVFKGGKLYLQAKFLNAIVEAFLAAQQCPSQPGVSLAGVQPWAKDLTQKCFDAYVKLFNVIPGQPTDTLVGNLEQYYFSDCEISLDLSNKNLPAETVLNITKALINHGLTITFLNLSGNSVNTPEVFDYMLPFLTGLQVLDLSNNGIGSSDSINPNGTVALGQGLRNLSTLTILDLSYNALGHLNSLGTVALGQGLRNLTMLAVLNLGNNNIGETDDRGVLALADSFEFLTHLKSLNLASNDFSGVDPANIILFGQNLRYLTALTELDLSFNNIIPKSADFALVFAHLKYLTQLVSLNLAYSNICNFKNEVVDPKALFETLQYLSGLKRLNLANNFISSVNTSVLGSLHQLEDFEFLPQFPDESGSTVQNSVIDAINEALNYTKAPPLPRLLETKVDVEEYCQTLPLDIATVDLSHRFSDPTESVIQILIRCLQNRSLLTSITFSNNNIGFWGQKNTFIQGLKFLKTLTNLDLSSNWIGYYDHQDDVIELTDSLQDLTKLEFLDLSYNALGRNPPGAITLGESLKYLIALKKLNLANTDLGYRSSIDALILAENLRYLPELTDLNLAFNILGGSGTNNTMKLGESLMFLTELTNLNLALSSVGFADAKGLVSFASGLNATRKLITLNLNNNFIGTTGPEGPEALLSVLPQLPHLDLVTLNLHGMTNISWSTAENVLQQLRSKLLMTKCQLSRCFGGDVSAGQGTIPVSQQLAFSEHNAVALDVREIIPTYSSGAYFPSSFWGEAAKGVSTIYQTLWEVAVHPEMQRIGWTVFGSKLAYATFQTWPLLATYAMLT